MPRVADDGPELEAALRRLYGASPPRFDLARLKGDASTRSYYRLRVTDPSFGGQPGGAPRSLIVMHLPADGLRSDEGAGGEKPLELPFLEVGRLLSSRGVPVPEVYLSDLSRRIVLLEDLGDRTLETLLLEQERGQWPGSYRPAVDLLARMHVACEKPDPSCIAYRRAFDRELLSWELDHFRQWGLEALFGPLNEGDRAELQGYFDRCLDALVRIPAGFVHRDFQSRNLMLAPRGDEPELVVIDFQDALQGPRPYDLVALLCDSYLEIDLDLQEEMIARYASRMELRGERARDFRGAFWTVAVHRKLKDAGRFVFIDRVRKNPDFLPYYPQSLCYVDRALDRLEGMNGLRELLGRLIPGFPDGVSEPPGSPGAGACSPDTEG
jgi:aminoglycoside/choline kinase family phosphotransferase